MRDVAQGALLLVNLDSLPSACSVFFHIPTESSPGKTMKQKSSCLGPMRISLASGSVHLVPHTGLTSVSGSISSAVATGEHLDQ